MKYGIEKIKKTISLKFKIRPFFAQGFFKNSIIHWLLLVLIILIVANWIILTILIDHERDYSIILHYNVYLGVDLVGEWWRAYLVPIVGTFTALLNSFLAWWFYFQEERIASYILLITAIMIQLGSAIAIAGILMINH